jgi:hypothetical protein
MPTQPLDVLPIWAVYLLTVIMGLLVVEAGIRLGRYWAKRRKEKEGKREDIGDLVGAALTLLAFLLVFMIGIASNRFDTRRQLVVNEANAIGTAYLRAGYLDEPDRTAIRVLLREYLDLRLDAATDPTKLPQSRARTEAILTELWTRAEAVARTNPDSELGVNFIEALNTVIDLHMERIVAVFNRIPLSNWLAVFAVAFLTLAMVGFNNGLTENCNPVAQLGLVLIFAAVLLLIVDVDRPQEGLLQISQQALMDLQQQLQVTGP